MSNVNTDRRLFFILLANIVSGIGTGITMIAIPWYLINREGGEAIFGYATLVSSAVLFFLSPYIGVVVDRVSRKRVLLFCQGVGTLFMLPFAVWAFLRHDLATWQLVLIQFGGLLYYNTQIPALYAFCQEIFHPSQYQKLTSTMEIQNQFASMISGGLASLLIEKWDASVILGIDAFTYLVGFLLFLGIPYAFTLRKNEGKQAKVWADIKEGYLYLKERPQITLFLFCTLLPFLVVMVGNYLNPIYVRSTLQADASILGISSMVFAIGAVAAGFISRLLLKKWGTYRAILFTYLAFTLSSVVVVVIPVASIFILNKLLVGWGNAGTRVIRNSFIMERIPNAVIGRVNSYYNGMGLAVRIALLAVSTQILTVTGAIMAFAILAVLLLAGLVGIVRSRKAVEGDVSDDDSLPQSG